jgi:Carboxypeptidase regulatory-like domain/TonB dependent receptor
MSSYAFGVLFRRPPLAFCAVLTAIALSVPSVVAQQVDDAIVVGTVFDSSHATVTGAIVKLTHLATNAVTEVRTDARGEYRTQSLKIGEYAITVGADGFKQSNQRGVVLEIGDVRKLDVVLEVGQTSESVNVEAEAPLLQASDSTVGDVINNRQIEELPLNGRDYLQLANLSSGTVPATQGVEIGGQAGTQVAFLLDGQDNNNQQISTSHSGQKEVVKPSVDAIQEFKVVTNGYSAEFGRSSSGVVSVALKSGTNELHGSAFEFIRNDIVDAKNLFATYKPPYKRNQFGSSAGGPVIRNKTFIFGDFEASYIRESTTTLSTLPTAAQRNGLFSSKIIDPYTGSPFPGNQIPSSLLDPVSLNILSFVPLPQTGAATSNYNYASPANEDNHRWDLRVDQIINDKQNLFFRFSDQVSDTVVSSPLPPVNGQYYAGAGATATNSKSFVLGYNQVWSPTVVSSIRAGWNDLAWTNYFPNQSLTGVGIPGVPTVNPGFSEMVITGYPDLGVSNVPNADASQDRQLSGDVTWSKGRHNLKFGVQEYWLQTNFLSSQLSSGVFDFDGQYTKNPLADFLLGAAYSTSLSNYSYLALRAPYTNFFAQDDWKLTSKLTLNIGLRYELDPPSVQKNNTISNFDEDTNPGHPVLVPAGSQGSSLADRALQNVNYNQWAPRLGLAYSLDSKTVIRAGAGTFYSNLITEGGMQSMEVNPPWNIRSVFTTNKNVAPTLVLADGFASDALNLANASNVQLISYDRKGVTPTDYQWNFNIQRQLPGGILLEVGYYGNKLDHMWRQIDGNPAPPEPGNINSNRPYHTTLVPGTDDTITLANVVRIQKDGWSAYNALQAKIEKRYSNGLTFIASYAYSKAIALGDTAAVQDQQDWMADKSVSSLNMTQHFVGSAVYQLPFGQGRQFGANWNRITNGFLGGWAFAPIFTVSTGLPLNITVNGNPSNTGSGADRPNVVGNWQLANPSVAEWFNTAAFVANAPYTYGDAGRNVIRGPGLVDLDLALHKSFRITEKVSAQLRIESFNSTNTPALGAPNTVLGNALFGQITATAVGTSSRDNQVGLKVVF